MSGYLFNRGCVFVLGAIFHANFNHVLIADERVTGCFDAGDYAVISLSSTLIARDKNIKTNIAMVAITTGDITKSPPANVKFELIEQQVEHTVHRHSRPDQHKITHFLAQKPALLPFGFDPEGRAR